MYCSDCNQPLDVFATFTVSENGKNIALCDSCCEICEVCESPLSFDESWDNVNPICFTCISSSGCDKAER